MAESITITTPPTGSEAPPVVTPPVVSGERPAWLPEKFATPEDMAKSYTELETKLGAPKTPDTPDPVVEPKSPTDTPTALVDAGFDLKALGTEFTENGGKLTDATMEKLAAKGIDKAAVETYATAAKAAAQGIVAEFAKAAGGEAQLEAVNKWAASNLPADEIEAYNSILDQGNKLSSKMAFDGLLSRYTAANGTEPTLVGGGSAPVASGALPFASQGQLVAAMSNPKYATDAAYRDEVAKRLMVTDMQFGA